MTEREQQAMDNRLISAILNGKDDKAIQLLNEGASPYAHDCMAVREAINNDRLNMLKVMLNDTNLLQHIQANPDLVCNSFTDEPQNSMQCLNYIVNETNIDVESAYKSKEQSFIAELELIKKFRLNYNMSQKPQRPKQVNKPHNMKI